MKEKGLEFSPFSDKIGDGYMLKCNWTLDFKGNSFMGHILFQEYLIDIHKVSGR